jgi:hypothetical protein
LDVQNSAENRADSGYHPGNYHWLDPKQDRGIPWNCFTGYWDFWRYPWQVEPFSSCAVEPFSRGIGLRKDLSGIFLIPVQAPMV